VLNKRTLTLFGATLAAVLLAGVAFAQAGSLAPRAPQPARTALSPVAGPVSMSAATVTYAPTSAPATDEPVSPSAQADRLIPFAITHPADGQHFEQKIITFAGTAPIGWTVTGAGYAATNDGKGNWSLVLILSPGANHAVLHATSPDGTAVQQEFVTAYYDVPDAAPTTSIPEPDPGAAEDVSLFTANSKYGEGWGRTPYDMYWGSGRPGDTVYVVSLYGDGEARVGPKGQWDLRVVYKDTPVGTPFDVVVQAGTGGESVFSFIYLGEHPGGDDDQDASDADDTREDPGDSGHDEDDDGTTDEDGAADEDDGDEEDADDDERDNDESDQDHDDDQASSEESSSRSDG